MSVTIVLAVSTLVTLIAGYRMGYTHGRETEEYGWLAWRDDLWFTFAQRGDWASAKALSDATSPQRDTP